MAGIRQFAAFTIPPVDLASDEHGAVWLTREGRTAVVYDEMGEIERHEVDPNPRLPLSFVAGSREPLYASDGYLWAGDRNLTASLGPRPWEEYAAVRSGEHIILRAFHAGRHEGERGQSWAILFGLGGSVRPTASDLFAISSSMSTDTVAFAARLSIGQGQEIQDRASLSDGWNPESRHVRPDVPRGEFLGDPKVSAGPEMHWAACLWRRTVDRKKRPPLDYSHQLPRVFVDGRKVLEDAAVASVPAGETTPAKLLWIPALTWAPGLGLCLGWQSRMPSGRDPGEVTVALLKDGRLLGRRIFPGFQPMLAPVHGQAKVWTASSSGLWGPA